MWFDPHTNSEVNAMHIGNMKRLLLGLALLGFGVVVFFYGMEDDTSKEVDSWYVAVRFVLLGVAIVSMMMRRSKSMRAIDNVLLIATSVVGVLGFILTILAVPDYNYGSSVLLVYTIPLVLISLNWIVGSFEKKLSV